jgi:hypothetical protein
MEKRQLIQAIVSMLRHKTGRQYRIELDALDLESLRELLRALRDFETEARMQISLARRMPWRRL